VWASRSWLRGAQGAPLVYTQLLAADVAIPLTLTPADLGYGAGRHGLYGADDGALLVFESNSSRGVRALTPAAPIQVGAAATKADFTLHTVAPVLAGGWALLGEADTKWVPVASARFANLSVADAAAGFTVGVAGAPGEAVRVVVGRPPSGTDLQTVACAIPASGVATLRMPAGECA